MNLEQFLQSKYQNLWIYEPQMEIYVRKGVHYHPILKEPINCLDIANVQVSAPNNGIFTRWLEKAISLANRWEFDAVYVESVLTERFANYFRVRDWIETSHEPPCFFMILSTSH